jgi:hypothetical protein
MYEIERLKLLQKDLTGEPLRKACWIEHLYRMNNLFHWGIENPTTEEMAAILEKQEVKLVAFRIKLALSILLGCIIGMLIV